MIIYNVQTGQRYFLNFPDDIFDEPEILNRIEIEKLTDKQLVIKYYTENRAKTKVYVYGR
jgi:hypothetical protein